MKSSSASEAIVSNPTCKVHVGSITQKGKFTEEVTI